LAEELRNINHGIIFVSLFLIIALGIIANLSIEDIYSILAIFLIILIALGNIGYLYSRLR
jgi:hypothetical protein